MRFARNALSVDVLAIVIARSRERNVAPSPNGRPRYLLSGLEKAEAIWLTFLPPNSDISLLKVRRLPILANHHTNAYGSPCGRNETGQNIKQGLYRRTDVSEPCFSYTSEVYCLAYYKKRSVAKNERAP